jgi:hypothetical protein
MTEALNGVDISKIMSEEGAIVKCVLLRCHPVDDGGGKPTAAANVTGDNKQNIKEMSIKEIKNELSSYGVNETFVEKDEMIRALRGERLKRAADTANKDANEATPSSTIDTASNSEEAAMVSQEEPTVPLSHLIDEITIDTTPRKSQVAQLLGGDFTFLGQYESEGVMVMVRRPDWDEDGEYKDEDVPPVNPHKLQPPLNDVEVRGDILLMRVAETKEELDEDDENEEDVSHEEPIQLHVPTSDEFFLDYTKEEYLKFAARTDVVWEEPEEEEESEEEEEEAETTMNGTTAHEEEEGDPTYDPEAEASSSDEEYDSEEHQIGMMNLILGQILRKFHEENGRGPNTLELLDMRKALADKLGVEVPEVDEEACDWDKKVPTPKKHNRKVVVDEEKNECETIDQLGGDGERVVNGEEGEECLKQSADVEVNGISEHYNELLSREEARERKRPPDALENSVSESDEHEDKKAKLENDNGDS